MKRMTAQRPSRLLIATHAEPAVTRRHRQTAGRAALHQLCQGQDIQLWERGGMAGAVMVRYR